MEQYQPPFHITNPMLMYSSSISKKLGKISVTGALDSKPHLRRNNRIRSIHSSLKIEASSLSLNQVRDILNGRLVLGKQKEIQEVKNAYAAYEKLPEIDPYKLSDLKNLHEIMTRFTVDESGSFRRGEEGVFNGDTCIFMAPPARLVPGNLFSNTFLLKARLKNFKTDTIKPSPAAIQKETSTHLSNLCLNRLIPYSKISRNRF